MGLAVHCRSLRSLWGTASAHRAAHADPKLNQNIAMERFCRPLATQFGVSAEAMRIRLERLGFLLREVPNTLF